MIRRIQIVFAKELVGFAKLLRFGFYLLVAAFITFYGLYFAPYTYMIYSDKIQKLDTSVDSNLVFIHNTYLYDFDKLFIPIDEFMPSNPCICWGHTYPPPCYVIDEYHQQSSERETSCFGMQEFWIQTAQKIDSNNLSDISSAHRAQYKASIVEELKEFSKYKTEDAIEYTLSIAFIGQIVILSFHYIRRFIRWVIYTSQLE